MTAGGEGKITNSPPKETSGETRLRITESEREGHWVCTTADTLLITSYQCSNQPAGYSSGSRKVIASKCPASARVGTQQQQQL